ncbi:MAG TPA: hypothetical protein VLV55_04825 [Rhizomicrobium sp.]|nr:hypothetical protein [Rhizomicrobium sp.]
MKTRFASLAALATSVVASLGLAATADARNPAAKPMFVVVPANAPGHIAPINQASQLVQWSGGFTDLTGHAIHFVMVGTDPTSTNTTTTVNVIVIPIKMVFGATNGNMTFNPKKDKYPDGVTVLARMKQSPVFTNNQFTIAAQNIGNTQYIDAFQRANFWNVGVSGESSYHVLLHIVKVEKPLKIAPTSSQGKVITNPFGTIKVGTMNINAFDPILNSYISSHSDIKPDTLPLFITDNVFLTQGGCCIGGYHSARGGPPGGQTYSYTTMVTENGSFSEDIDALSHEVGEWQDDPFTNNHVNCNDNSILEVGDPLETFANYGTFTLTEGGFTYHPQDLVFLAYFGAPITTSVNNQLSFDNMMTNVCPGQ